LKEYERARVIYKVPFQSLLFWWGSLIRSRFSSHYRVSHAQNPPHYTPHIQNSKSSMAYAPLSRAPSSENAASNTKTNLRTTDTTMMYGSIIVALRKMLSGISKPKVPRLTNTNRLSYVLEKCMNRRCRRFRLRKKNAIGGGIYFCG
jgi:hypothetical protein